jgi:AcrR family transcriptional regulator
LAAAAGVTQPLLYRHFSGKAELYVACLEQAWNELRTEWEQSIADEPDPAQWIPRLAMSGLQLICDTDKGQLWMRGIVEASDDEQVRTVVADTLRSAHDFLRDSIQRAQDAGAIDPGIPARTEAWLFVATGLLVVASNRLGGIVGDDIFEMLQAGHERMLRNA